MEKSFEDEEIHACVFKESNLLGDVIPGCIKHAEARAFDELRTRDAASHQGFVSRNFLRKFHCRMIYLFGLGAVPSPAQFFARTEERTGLQPLRNGLQELPMQFTP